ncbi:nudix hydrolase 10-like [Syzygium oleosum]|uniref:nudix hydrolase 10-like n=1 Tax=Syzygium oleosum TaxID=219896 RepID=UPI0011D27900|nr:nudix hydrolase 10-like [Syzygium oleosum]
MSLSMDGNVAGGVGTVFENGFDHDLLPSTEDQHEGVIVENLEIAAPMGPEVFGARLRASISEWKRKGKKGVWIKFPPELANLVESAIQVGFRYHHAEPSYLMMTYWIPESTCMLPANASHRVRVGAIVLNDKREVLVVQEKSGALKGMGLWKIPTGVVDEDEDIEAAATREVKEETGIDTEFKEILLFRQSHKAFFEKSELFFLCILRPLSFDIQKQDLEIEAAQWLPLEDFAAQPFAQQNDLCECITEICLARANHDYSRFVPVDTPTRSISDNGLQYVYLNAKTLLRG